MGDYATEVTYKYVGPGAGSLAFTSSKIFLCGRISCCFLAILLIALLLIFFPWPTPTSSTTAINPTPILPIFGECLMWGDPHIKTFDGGRPSFYGEGEYWIIKSRQVWIQGRYLATPYTEGLSAVNKVIVGGPFLQGHKIAVGTVESGDFTVDGASICSNFPCSYQLGNLASITYNSFGELPDPEGTAQGQSGAKRVVTIQLPLRVRLQIFRWNNYLDLRLIVPNSLGVDGTCGNFNGNPADDSSTAIMERGMARVKPSENMFQHSAIARWTDTDEKLMGLCQPDKMARAQTFCHGVFEGSGTALQHKSCQLDYCWGDNHHALKYAKEHGF